MTKKDIAKVIAEAVSITQVQAQDIVQRVFNGIIETLVEKGRIELRNFGVFEVKKRKPRQARNPRTGETVLVPERAGRRHLQAGPGDGRKGPSVSPALEIAAKPDKKRTRPEVPAAA